MFGTGRFHEPCGGGGGSCFPGRTRLVVVLASEASPLLDLAGPLQAFATAAEEAHAAGGPEHSYEVLTASHQGGLIRSACGVEFKTRAVAELDGREIDTLLVLGAPREACTPDPRSIAWLRARRSGARRIGAVAAGAFLAAACGLLDGRKATTHWSLRAELQRRFPAVQVQADALFVEDGAIWTSAGETSGIDMALAMIEADRGRPLAVEVARQLVLFARRSGGQPQVSAQLRSQAIRDDNLRRLVEWILENPGASVDAEGLARRAHMSVRTLYRAFKDNLDATPREFVERVRLEAARRDLEQSQARIDRVAIDAGFSSTEAMRRAFKRHLEMTPLSYRDRGSESRRMS